MMWLFRISVAIALLISHRGESYENIAMLPVYPSSIGRWRLSNEFSLSVSTVDSHMYYKSPKAVHVHRIIENPPKLRIPKGINSLQWRQLFLLGIGEKVLKTVLPDPPSLQEFLFSNQSLLPFHQLQVFRIWKKISKIGTLKQISTVETNLVQEALKFVYVVLWERFGCQTLKLSFDTVAGVAAILSEMRMDLNTILAGILCNVIDHNGVEFKFMEIYYNETGGKEKVISNDVEQRLRQTFGNNSITLAIAYNKLHKLKSRNTEISLQQAENHIQFLTVTTDDYRCLYMRIADRLNTLRLINKCDLNQLGQAYAQETLLVYSTLARRMNLKKVGCEIEDRCFEITHPEISKVMESSRIASAEILSRFKQKIVAVLSNDATLKDHGVSFKLTARIKSAYQTYLKQIRKGFLDPCQVQDLLGIRVIFAYPRHALEENIDYLDRGNMLCNHIANSLNTSLGSGLIEVGRKDYIANSKCNGYQSLHQYLALEAPNKYVVNSAELQIRTKQMHISAELGEAAHWFYKDMMYRPEIARSKLYSMVWRCGEQLQASTHAQVFGLAKAKLLSSRVLVLLEDQFTILNLRKGNTALDAAFIVHSLMGLATEEIRLNRQRVDLSTPLKTGDIVSIRMATHRTVQSSWLRMVKSTRAINILRQYLNTSITEHE